jgi:hypothetical protein
MIGLLVKADLTSRSGVLNDAQVLAFRANLGKSRMNELGTKPSIATIISKPFNNISTRAAASSVNAPSTIIKLPFPAFARSPVEVDARRYSTNDSKELELSANEGEGEDSASCHEPLSKRTKLDHLASYPLGIFNDSPEVALGKKDDSVLPSEVSLLATTGGSIQQSPTNIGQLDYEMDLENRQLSPAGSFGDNGSPSFVKEIATNSPARSSPLKEKSDSPSMSASPSIGKRVRRKSTINASKGTQLYSNA